MLLLDIAPPAVAWLFVFDMETFADHWGDNLYSGFFGCGEGTLGGVGPGVEGEGECCPVDRHIDFAL